MLSINKAALAAQEAVKEQVGRQGRLKDVFFESCCRRCGASISGASILSTLNHGSCSVM